MLTRLFSHEGRLAYSYLYISRNNQTKKLQDLHGIYYQSWQAILSALCLHQDLGSPVYTSSFLGILCECALTRSILCLPVEVSKVCRGHEMFYCLGSSGLSFYSILILIRIELIKIRLWASCYDLLCFCFFRPFLCYT